MTCNCATSSSRGRGLVHIIKTSLVLEVLKPSLGLCAPVLLAASQSEPQQERHRAERGRPGSQKVSEVGVFHKGMELPALGPWY